MSFAKPMALWSVRLSCRQNTRYLLSQKGCVEWLSGTFRCSQCRPHNLRARQMRRSVFRQLSHSRALPNIAWDLAPADQPPVPGLAPPPMSRMTSNRPNERLALIQPRPPLARLNLGHQISSHQRRPVLHRQTHRQQAALRLDSHPRVQLLWLEHPSRFRRRKILS